MYGYEKLTSTYIDSLKVPAFFMSEISQHI